MGGKIIAVVGMCGSGKTEVSTHLLKKGYKFLRFGQLTMDEIRKRGLDVTEENEKKVREGLRKDHGMAAFALLNIPKIDEMIKKGNVVVDGLYSWEEYKVLKDRYNENLTVIAVYSSPKTRYERLADRKLKADDKDMKKRPIPKEKAEARDKAEIENVQKGGPIAMADYTIVNEGSVDELKQNIDKFLKTVDEK